MKKTYYEKVGARYVPVAEYDSEYLDSFSKGTHIVMCYPGGQSRRYNIDPDYAALIAAGRVAEEAMSKAMYDASQLKPSKKPITAGQQRAWRKLAKEFGEELYQLNGVSTHDIVQEGLKALQKEADVLYSNPAVRKAYDHFILMCKLTKEQE